MEIDKFSPGELMSHTIMLVPTTADVNTEHSALNLKNLLTNNKISADIFPEFNIQAIENFLANNDSDSLLANIVQQYDDSTAQDTLLIIPGLSLDKPYAAELNFSIATTLGSAILFIIDLQQNSATILQQLKIIANPYQYRYKLPILGCMMLKHSHDQILPETKKTLTNMQIPLLGVICKTNSNHNDNLYHCENHGHNILTDNKETDENLNFQPIQKLLRTSTAQPMTPAIFKNRLIKLASGANKKIVLPEGEEPRTIEAANICAARGIAQCILLGDKNEIHNRCAQLNLQLHEHVSIIEPLTVSEKYADQLYELRKSKGLTLENAKNQLKDNVVLGTMILNSGEVDGLVSGAIHTTANTIRPALQIIKTPPNVKLVSSVFFMCLPDKVLVYGDCAINPNPNAEELADIAIQSALSAAAFGIAPKIAMLSYSTGSSGTGETVDKVRTATEIVKKLRPDLEIEGPIQYDAAISEETAQLKAPNSTVAGHATVFVMPDLNVGNIAYKAVQRSTGIVCVGPMLQGLRKPVNDLSRGCSVDDIVFTIAVTAIQALQNT